MRLNASYKKKSRKTKSTFNRIAFVLFLLSGSIFQISADYMNHDTSHISTTSPTRHSDLFAPRRDTASHMLANTECERAVPRNENEACARFASAMGGGLYVMMAAVHARCLQRAAEMYVI